MSLKLSADVECYFRAKHDSNVKHFDSRIIKQKFDK